MSKRQKPKNEIVDVAGGKLVRLPEVEAEPAATRAQMFGISHGIVVSQREVPAQICAASPASGAGRSGTHNFVRRSYVNGELA